MDALNSVIFLLNHWGQVSCDFAGRMLLQSGLLIGLLLIADRYLRTRVCACFRYGMWLLVPLKLMLPPSLALPTSISYWLGAHAPAVPVVSVPSAPVALPAPAAASVATLGKAVATLAHIEDVSVITHRIVPLEWPGLLLLAWVVGVMLLIVLILRRVASVRSSLRRSHPAEGQMLTLLEQCRVKLGITAQVTLRLSEDMHSPCVCGFLHPVVLLPAVLPVELGQAAIRTILTHELAHIKRRDPWVSLAQTALQVAYFWHPLVWVANTRLRLLREQAVDETVVATLRSQARCYTDTLIDIAAMTFRKPAFSLRVIGIAESKSALERRITHMLNQRIMKHPTLGRSGLLVILVLGALLVPMGRGHFTARAEQAVDLNVPALPAEIPELFQLTKDEILARFGEPRAIFYGDKQYTLKDLPQIYFMSYGDISFHINDGTPVGITLLGPAYVFGNGIRVGDSEDKVKQAFGPPSEVEETEFKDFLVYEQLGLSFEINKQDRTVMEINISREYGDAAVMASYANAPEFIAKLPERIAKLNIDTADLSQVLATFGTPIKYVWGPKTLSADKLPDRFIAVYPGSFNVFMMDNHIVEIRHEGGSKYVYTGGLHVGSTLDEALAVLGAPVKTVEGKPIDWGNAKDVLFKDIEGRKGHCYYHLPELKVRVWFANYKIAAIYMTRSDYGSDSRPSPLVAFDAEFARLLADRVAGLDIDTADPQQVKAIFGEPGKYVWGDKTFTADTLPDCYIMCYPCDFNVWIRDGKIMEIRHERGSPYLYRGTLHVGSSLQEVLDLLGDPAETVTGQKNAFKDNVLYLDINGTTGHDYYHRTDQKVRIWLWDNKVIAIYMTRSDFAAAK